VPGRNLAGRHQGQTIIRLHIGLEDPQDLMEDLGRGLSLLENQTPQGNARNAR
jgi:cysteine-S-conjugate beta-lyase